MEVYFFPSLVIEYQLQDRYAGLKHFIDLLNPDQF